MEREVRVLATDIQTLGEYIYLRCMEQKPESYNVGKALDELIEKATIIQEAIGYVRRDSESSQDNSQS